MLLIDIFVRFPSMTLCALLIALLARDAHRYFQAWLAIGILVASIASSLHTLPRALNLPEAVYAIALFVSVPASALSWWLIRSILEDRFRPGITDWTIMGAALLFKLGWSLQGIGIMPPAHELRYMGSYTLNLLMALYICLLYTSPSPRDLSTSRMPSSA